MSQKIYNIDDLIILFNNMDELDFVELQLQLQSVNEIRNSNEVKMKQNIILNFIKSITKRIINTTEKTKLERVINGEQAYIQLQHIDNDGLTTKRHDIISCFYKPYNNDKIIIIKYMYDNNINSKHWTHEIFNKNVFLREPVKETKPKNDEPMFTHLVPKDDCVFGKRLNDAFKIHNDLMYQYLEDVAIHKKTIKDRYVKMGKVQDGHPALVNIAISHNDYNFQYKFEVDNCKFANLNDYEEDIITIRYKVADAFKTIRYNIDEFNHRVTLIDINRFNDYTNKPRLKTKDDIYYTGCGCTWDEDLDGKRYHKLYHPCLTNNPSYNHLNFNDIVDDEARIIQSIKNRNNKLDDNIDLNFFKDIPYCIKSAMGVIIKNPIHSTIHPTINQKQETMTNTDKLNKVLNGKEAYFCGKYKGEEYQSKIINIFYHKTFDKPNNIVITFISPINNELVSLSIDLKYFNANVKLKEELVFKANMLKVGEMMQVTQDTLNYKGQTLLKTHNNIVSLSKPNLVWDTACTLEGIKLPSGYEFIYKQP